MKVSYWCLLCSKWTTIKIDEKVYRNWQKSGDGRSLRTVKDEDSHLITNGFHKEC